MNAVSQNKALVSLEQALLPPSSLIDGRTEQDRLCFLAEFASLVNFYDDTNTFQGNWSPFLLKDPVILLTVIANTKYAKLLSEFEATCFNISTLLTPTQKGNITESSGKPGQETTGASFNYLFDLLTGMFMMIRRWIHYMVNSEEHYPLKRYVLHQAENHISPYFWAILALRRVLYLSSKLPGITLPDNSPFFKTSSFSEIIWTQNKEKSPYWEVLHLEGAVTADTSLSSVLQAINGAGNVVFGFLKTVIRRAKEEYSGVSSLESKYPDTLLLRAFANVLSVHRDQLNGITEKHLNFYYKDILRQKPLPAQPDKTFLCATLGQNTPAFLLPAGTRFTAGPDAKKNPILFANDKDVWLNQATLHSAVTLGVSGKTIYKQTIGAPGIAATGITGHVQSWSTFGPASSGTVTNQGFAIASPLLLLSGGTRTVIIVFSLSGTYDDSLFTTANWYLSTEAGWLLIPPSQTPSPVSAVTISSSNTENGTHIVATVSNMENESYTVTATISLMASVPPVTRFANNRAPDGFISSWPMLKIEFTSFPEISLPPVLTSFTITVTASGVPDVQLYNDSGLLASKTPFLPFGNMPLHSSNFIIGSSEIFSKPVTSLNFTLLWDNLPVTEGFTNYYSAYNAYLGADWEDNTSQASRWKRFWDWLSNWAKPKKTLPQPAPQSSPATPLQPVPPQPGSVKPADIFSDSCFLIESEALENGVWTGLPLYNKASVDKGNPTTSKQLFSVTYPGQTPASPTPVDPGKADPVVVTPNMVLLDTSTFVYQPTGSQEPLKSCDPAIQNTPLKFTGNNSRGFMRMTLSNPVYGFGSRLYPGVIQYFSMLSAWEIYKGRNDSEPPQHMAVKVNVPFVPKVKTFTATYTAYDQYTFSSADSYPLQCFSYSPFTICKIYDSEAAGFTNCGNLLRKLKEETATIKGIPLYEAIPFSGSLFLELSNLAVSGELNLYFELSNTVSAAQASGQVISQYLNAEGWRPLTVLSDGTNGFSCTGIVTVVIPEDIANNGLVMPGTNNWLSFSIKGETAFARTVMVSTNGFLVRRISDISNSTTLQPVKANSITKSFAALSQVASVTQPTPSFGSREAETLTGMNRRVSTQVKTKGRALTADDYFRLIKQKDPDIFFSRTLHTPLPVGSRSISVYVVKKVQSPKEPGAFLPQISTCHLDEIRSFLLKKASPLFELTVQNFTFQYVRVIMKITLANGAELSGVQSSIKAFLNLYLSPWIAGTQPQMEAGGSVSSPRLYKLVKEINGVAEVTDICFQTWLAGTPVPLLTPAGIPVDPCFQSVSPLSDAAIIVSSNDSIILKTSGL